MSLSDFRLRCHVVLLQRGGMSMAAISRRPEIKVKLSIHQVHRLCRRFKAVGIEALRPQKWPIRKTTPEEDRALLEAAKANPHVPVPEILKKYVPRYSGSLKVAYDRLHSNGIWRGKNATSKKTKERTDKRSTTGSTQLVATSLAQKSREKLVRAEKSTSKCNDRDANFVSKSLKAKTQIQSSKPVWRIVKQLTRAFCLSIRIMAKNTRYYASVMEKFH